jgi:hypothetical protein
MLDADSALAPSSPAALVTCAQAPVKPPPPNTHTSAGLTAVSP